MREIADNRIIKPPTAEIVNTLQLLSMLDEITPTQFNLYAAQNGGLSPGYAAFTA